MADHTFRQIAFLKSYSTQCGQETARDAVQIFGGRGVTKSGMGKFIEHVSSHSPAVSLSFTEYTLSITEQLPSMLFSAEPKMSWQILV